MNSIWSDKRIFLVGGSGGVGKTTIAASLGIRLALEGYKTVVLTVDPAKRLAQALGFTSINAELQAVNLPQKPDAVLFASMLDTQRYFDRIIARFATSEKQRDKILNNRLYRVMVESLGGSHEYAAMERLLEFAKDTQFDKIVVDTPPSQNSVDLLKAPEKLAEFMDSSVLRWFQGKHPPFLSIFKQGTKVAMKLLERVFGTEFFAALGETLDDLEGMQSGFRNRNLEVIQLLKSEATGFFLVSYPSEIRFEESIYFLRILKEYQIQVSGLILNRLEIPAPPEVGSDTVLTEPLKTNLNQMLAYHRTLCSQQAIWIKKFKEVLADLPMYSINRQYVEVHHLEKLAELSNAVVF